MSTDTNFAAGLLPHVLAAGKVVMDYFRRGFEVETKAGGSPVTAADRDAEALLVRALSELAPNVPVVAEEMMEGRTAQPVGETFFLVDALDGTREFTSGRKEFTINVGLIEKGLPTFGVVYAPALAKLYMTLSRDEAVTAELSPDVQLPGFGQLAAEKISVKSDVDPDGPFIVCASRSHGSDALEQWLGGINVGGRTNIGSSLKFCQVAEGQCHVYPRFGPTKEWDTAAGHAIVQAAGGVVTELDGQPLRYGKYETDFLNPHFIVAAKAVPSFFKEKSES